MLKKANMPWPVKTLKNQVDRSNVLFDLVIQRGKVWDLERNSLIQHSAIEGYPIPAFYFVKRPDGKYDAIDGQQRANAFHGFINGEFALHPDTPPVRDEDGFYHEIANLYFNDLPEWMRDNILSYSLTIYYFEDITDEEIREMFWRINFGKPLTNAELTRVKAVSLPQFIDVATHPMIDEAITEKGKKSRAHETVAMQSYVLSYVDSPSLELKDYRNLIIKSVVTDAQVQEMKAALDLVYALKGRLDPENKEDKRVLTKIQRRSHLVSCLYLGIHALRKGIDEEAFGDLVYQFFNTTSTSQNSDYNESVGSGSTKPEKVRLRIKALDDLLTQVG